MNRQRQRPLALTDLRSFEVVARRLSFSAAAQELFVTQSAVSRQIKSLEIELGAALFNRGTRRVELTPAGQTLRQALLPALDGIDHAVRQIRVASGRRQVNLSTFASFASLWLLPRLASFQQQHADIDIRISANDSLTELDDPQIDLVLRYGFASNVPPGTEMMFAERISPVVSPMLLAQARNGQAPPLDSPADLAGHALLDEDDHRPSAALLRWRRWLQLQGLPRLEPRRWVYLNYTHQQVQAALAGQGVALARLPMVHDLLARGELVEPFGPAGRSDAPTGYWLLPLPGARLSSELQAFIAWVRGQAALTRQALSDAPPASS